MTSIVNKTGNDAIDAVLWGYKWDQTSFTYSFPMGTGEYLDSYINPSDPLDTDTGYRAITGFTAFNAAQQAAVRNIFDDVSSFSNLTFTQTTAPDADLRFAEANSVTYTNDNTVASRTGVQNIGSATSNPPELGFDGRAPESAPYAQGDSWFNHTLYTSPVLGNFAYTAGIIHEIGHNLGLKHGHISQTKHGTTFPQASDDHDSHEYSVMTYRAFPFAPVRNNYDVATPNNNFPQTFMQDDIAALQFLYGANYNYWNTDTRYSWSETTGEMFINSGYGGLGQPNSNYVFMTLWDGGGTDTYEFFNYKTNMSIDLAPGAWTVFDTSAAHLQRANLGNNQMGGADYFARGNVANAQVDPNNPNETASLIENAIAGIGDDVLYGNKVDNLLSGYEGNDVLNGREGRDTLQGWRGNDVYYLTDISPIYADGFLIDEVYDTIVEYDRDALTEPADSGIDTVHVWSVERHATVAPFTLFTTSYSLPDNVEMGVVEGDRPFNITGNDLDNKFYGNPAANTFDGGLGNDVVDYGLSEAGVEVFLADQALNGGGALGDRFISIEGVAGTRFSDQLRGDANSNNLWGYGDSDVLYGGEGNDGMDGGEGSDAFVVDNGTAAGGDVAIGGAGFDQVIADSSLVSSGLRLNVFSDGTPITSEVNRVANTSAAIGVEMVFGASGNDWIDASRLGTGEGLQVIGGAGHDTFVSGAGKDSFFGDAGTDTIVYSGVPSNYAVTAIGTRGTEFSITDRTTGTIDDVHDVELVRFNGVTAALAATTLKTGTEGADVLVGDAASNIMDGLGGDDVLTGGAGADSFVGGTGRDLMYVDAQDTSIQGGDGFDIVYADAGTAATGLRFALAGTGVESVFGNAGNDVLDASGAANDYNMSFGGAGNDVLIASSAGNYTMQGGAGIDTAVFAGNQSDYTIDGGTPIGWPSWLRVTNNATGAVSWLQTVEQLQFADGTIDAPGLLLTALGTAGADVINAVAGGQVIHGLAGDDRLTGGSGEDVLDGGAGADWMSGGAGNDSFFIDNSDTLVAGGEGYDSVYVDDTQGAPGSVRFALAGTNVEFVYGGVGNDVFDASGVSSMVELWGQWGDDALTGGAGDDTLLGDYGLPGGGNDVLDGGAGNDWLDGGNGNDTFVFRLGSGVDTLYDFGQTYHYDPAAGIDAMEPGDRDFIRFEGGPFANFAALAGSGAMVQSGANVVITLSAADQITLRNVQLGTLDAADFLFTNQVINGTSNADALSGQGSDTIHGFGGNDLITGTGNTGVAFGDDGGDQLYFTGNQNQLFGGEGNDWLGVNGNNNALVGGAGDEVWIGASGSSNTLAGGDGGDALFANGTGNYLHGENGNDWLGVSGTQNRLFGGAGSEWMGASGNDNVLYGGEGGDTLFSVGANVLYGQTGDDWIGCSGNGNVLDGAQGNDYLAASGNNNTLDGGAGNDILVAGGAHSGDRFVFHVGYGMDTVSNFSRHGAGGSDVVDLNGFGLNFNSLQAYTADVGGNVVITLDAATILTIDGITKGQLQADDFLF